MRALALRSTTAMVGAGLLLAGCGGGNAKTAASSSPVASPKDATYATTSDLLAALASHGITCSDSFQQDTGASNDGVTSQGRCTLVGSSAQEVLGTYDTVANAQSSGDKTKAVLVTIETPEIVVGPDWVVNCDADAAIAQRIVDAIGGAIA